MLKKSLYIILLLLLSSFKVVVSTEEEEYNLKAAFLYNFTNYIEWNDTEHNEFIIGVLGSTEILDPLLDIAETQKVKNKRISIKHFQNSGEVEFCHILFISREVTTPLASIKPKISKEKTLTVSENREYAVQGTAINFIIIDNKLKFEANIKAINETQLKVSSQLLKLAVNIAE